MRAEGCILALNAGSSSLKLGLFDAHAEEQLAEARTNWSASEPAEADAALKGLLAEFDTGSICVVGHRVVHGGSKYTSPVLIDAAVAGEIASLAALAPQHNRPALSMIEAVARLFPGIPQAAVFDTAFHATLPPRAYLYPLPYDWHERWGIRRFGFHGLSHAYSAERAAAMLGSPLEALKLVTCHLGSGCSLAAIAGGRSLATTMGFTPLDGLMMATRPGSVDPGILTYLLREKRITLAELEEALHHQSGLQGISGTTSDMRDILAARVDGDERATLAFDLYVTRLREGIAAMAATLGGIDALVFTGGVGEHAAEVRAAACAGFAWIGLTIDELANAAATTDANIASPESRVRVLVVRAREELMIARATGEALRGASRLDREWRGE